MSAAENQATVTALPGAGGRGDGVVRAIRAITRVNGLAAALAAVLLWALVVLVFGDIVLRAIGAPLLWSNEVSVYLLIALVYLGIGNTYDHDGHFSILLLVDKLPRKPRMGVELVTVLLSLGFVILLTIGGIGLVQFAHSMTMSSPTLLHVPLTIPYSCVIVGGVSLSLSLIVRALTLIDALQRGVDLNNRTEHSI
jgi:TRAP-type C4-dicarboxylate transport system permease small subunit